MAIDQRTGRPFGDHGTAAQAIEYALDHTGGMGEKFLHAWRDGRTAAEWPEFYLWLGRTDRQAVAA